MARRGDDPLPGDGVKSAAPEAGVSLLRQLLQARLVPERGNYRLLERLGTGLQLLLVHQERGFCIDE